MEKEAFRSYLDKNKLQIEAICDAAVELHDSVGQYYDGTKPYGFHLKMAATLAERYGWQVIAAEDDIVPVIFGAYYHDSIEDARYSYNDVKRKALEFMNEEQAHLAAEIVYALTNEKGRTRAERANDKYYAGIRQTPYAPFVKMCDRFANMSYSTSQSKNYMNKSMLKLYAKEWHHFKDSLMVENGDKRFSIPTEMLNEIERVIELGHDCQS